MLTLNYRDSRPIYGQIKDGLRKLIVTGALAPNEKLPSVRAMAMELAINPNTIQRAYAELEAEGFLYTIPGKGSFAAMGADRRLRREELTDRLRELIAELRCLQMTDQR
ncbi:MAG: GntR family transcriptional regulator [Dysosmobacter welbionis]